MTYTHYRTNGEMVDDWRFLDLHGAAGVGQYDTAWPRIEAEWFMSATACEKIQIDTALTNESFAVRFVNASSALTFPNVLGLPQVGTLTLSLREVAGKGSISVFADDANNTASPLARCGTSNGNISCPFHLGNRPVSGVVFRYEPTKPAAGSVGVVLDSWNLNPHHL